MNAAVKEIIQKLHLEPHPVEGGYFRETWRSPENAPRAALERHGAPRSVGTAIYYLLDADAVSEMHKLPGDELFHFYAGDPVEMLQLHPDGSQNLLMLGSDIGAGEQPQLCVPGGVWQGSRVLPGPHGFALLGATMAPGFDYADYQTGYRDELSARWPEAAAAIACRTPRG